MLANERGECKGKKVQAQNRAADFSVAHNKNGMTAFLSFGYSLKCFLYHLWLLIALGAKLRKVKRKNAQAGAELAARAKPNHSIISPEIEKKGREERNGRKEGSGREE